MLHAHAVMPTKNRATSEAYGMAVIDRICVGDGIPYPWSLEMTEPRVIS
jgi:hypothetical protein